MRTHTIATAVSRVPVCRVRTTDVFLLSISFFDSHTRVTKDTIPRVLSVGCLQPVPRWVPELRSPGLETRDIKRFLHDEYFESRGAGILHIPGSFVCMIMNYEYEFIHRKYPPCIPSISRDIDRPANLEIPGRFPMHIFVVFESEETQDTEGQAQSLTKSENEKRKRKWTPCRKERDDCGGRGEKAR